MAPGAHLKRDRYHALCKSKIAVVIVSAGVLERLALSQIDMNKDVSCEWHSRHKSECVIILLRAACFPPCIRAVSTLIHLFNDDRT